MIERLLYFALAAVFFTMIGISIVLLGFDHKLNLEMNQLQVISKQNQTTLNEVKQDNQIELSYIRCIAGLFAASANVTLVNLDTCQTSVVTTPPATAQPSSPASGSTGSSPANSATPSPSPKPQPNSLFNRIVKDLGL